MRFTKDHVPEYRRATLAWMIVMLAHVSLNAAPATLRNLAPDAVAATPHPAQRAVRTASKAIDGIAGDNADHGWVPAVTGISADRPALIALTWPRPVAVHRIVLRQLEGKAWPLAAYTLARWTGTEAPELGAPVTTFPHHDVFVSGTEGYHTFRIPALVMTKAGTLLAFCEGRRLDARDFGDIDLLVRRSADEGRTWGPIQTIHGEDGRITIGNPVPIVDRITGDVHLVYARNGKTLLYRKSQDDGATFSEPRDITSLVQAMTAAADIEWNHVLPGPGHGLQCANGRLIVQIKTSGHTRGGPRRRVGAIFSDDHGRTWKPGGWIPATKGEMSESTLFERKDGTVVMNTRWHDGPHRVVSLSRDGGLTWSEPQPDPQLPDPVCEGSILRVDHGAGATRVYFSNIVPEASSAQLLAGRRSRLVVRSSEDDGRTWNRARVIVPGPAGYSDLAAAGDGSLLVLFEQGRMMYSEKLTLARMRPADFETEAGRTAAELAEERYDLATVKRIMASPAWEPFVSVKDAPRNTSHEHRFAEPIETRTLLLVVTRTHQPEGLAYLQELEVWGVSK